MANDGRVHIRDIMASKMDSLDDLQQVTMCEIQHSTGSKLTFGVPAASTCEKCIRIWNAERESLQDEKRALHKIRLGLHSSINHNDDTKRSKLWAKAGK